MKVRDTIKLLSHQPSASWIVSEAAIASSVIPTKVGSVTVAGKPSTDIPPGDFGIDSPAGRSRSVAMSEYAVIYEQGPASWGAWVPDLPGCVAAGKSRDEVEQLIVEAIKAHIESLREHGEPVPEPASTAGAVQVSAA